MFDVFIEYISDAHWYYLVVIIPFFSVSMVFLTQNKFKMAAMFFGVTFTLFFLVGWASGRYQKRVIPQYIMAAEQGEAAGQFNLGKAHFYGKGKSLGLAHDRAEAVKWYRKSAEQGYGDAQYELGMCYYRGDGVEKNRAEALRWWREAAEKGHAGAQKKAAQTKDGMETRQAHDGGRTDWPQFLFLGVVGFFLFSLLNKSK